MVSKKSRSEVRVKKHNRLRNHLSGTTECPRLAVFRSNNHMYAQIIDDTVGKTLVSASTNEPEAKKALEKTNNVEAAAYVGKVIAERAIEKGYEKYVILLTRNRGYRREDSDVSDRVKYAYKDYPKFIESMENEKNKYI